MSTSTDTPRVGTTTDRRQSVAALLEATDEALKRGARPGAQVWPTGFDLLDSTLNGGLRSGELVLLGGSEGAGKTTMALQMVRNAVRAGRHAVVFSFEHDAQTLVQRLISLEAATAAVEAGQHPAAAGDVHAVRAVFEAEDPDRRGLSDALAHIPYGSDAYLAVQEYAPRLHIHESNQQTDPDEVAGVLSAVREQGRRATPRARRLPPEDAARAPHRRRGLPRHGRHRAAQGHVPRVRVPRRVHLRGRPREPGRGPPHAHPRPARLLGPRLRGRPRHHPVEQGEHRLAGAPRLRPRQRAALPPLGGHHGREEPARAGPGRARGAEGLRARPLPPQAQVVTERLIEERIFTN